MLSPYKAPAATFNDDASIQDSLRRRGAVYFAFTPTLFMIFAQGSVIYSESRYGPIYWRLNLLEPLLYCVPVCLLMAASGYAVAIRCAGKARSAFSAGCVVGAVWVLVVMAVGNAIAQLNGATPITLERFIRQISILPAIFVPLAVALCVFTRWRAVRLGAVNEPG